MIIVYRLAARKADDLNRGSSELWILRAVLDDDCSVDGNLYKLEKRERDAVG